MGVNGNVRQVYEVVNRPARVHEVVNRLARRAGVHKIVVPKIGIFECLVGRVAAGFFRIQIRISASAIQMHGKRLAFNLRGKK